METRPCPDEESPSRPTGEKPALHPVALGIGAASGAAVGAGLGTLGGPVGVIAGGAVGALVGGLAGQASAGGIDLPAEAIRWEQHFRREPYFHSGFTFADYWPAYLFGIDHYRRDVDFAQAEADMERAWISRQGSSRLDRTMAKEAARASWQRLHSTPGPALPP